MLEQIRRRLLNTQLPAPNLDELYGFHEKLQSLIQAEPGRAEYYQEITRVLILMKRPLEALTLLQSAKNVDEPALLNAALGAAYSYLAFLYNTKEWDKAAEAYRAALKDAPDNMAWLYRLAYAENQQGRPDVSRECIARIFELEKGGQEKFRRRDLLLELAAMNDDTQAMIQVGLKKAEAAHYLFRHKLGLARTGVLAVTPQMTKFYEALCARVEAWRPSRRALVDVLNGTIDGVILCKNAFYHSEDQREHVKVTNGIRLTVGQPQTCDRTVYLCGASPIFGFGCADRHTIASFLQALYNQGNGKEKTAVINYGVIAQYIDNTLLMILNTDLKPGDRVLSLLGSFEIGFLGAETVMNCAAAINEACKAKGAEYCLMFQPRLSDMPRRSLYDQKMWAAESLKPRSVSPEMLNTMANRLIADGIKTFDLQPLVDDERDGDLFLTNIHFGPNGAKALANAVFSILEPITRGLSPAQTPAKDQALQRLAFVVREKYANQTDVTAWLGRAATDKPKAAGPFGAIVMNCNPFTNGHLYLISEALKRAQGLYIFVVEENLSHFSFADRLQMVKDGTARFGDRVKVLPSGKFIISSFSFPGYFSKEKILDSANTDPTLDVLMFGAVIAPALHIGCRFIGEEPFCQVTAQYNESLRFVLPSLGIDVVTVERCELNGQAISASAVRKAISDGRADLAQAMLPPSTLKFLNRTKALG